MKRSVWAIAGLSFIAGMLTVIVLIEIMKSRPTQAGVASIDSKQPVVAEVPRWIGRHLEVGGSIDRGQPRRFDFRRRLTATRDGSENPSD